MSFFSDVADIVSGGYGIYQGIAGSGPSDAESQALGASKTAERLALASVRPNSKKFRNLVALFEEANRRRAVEEVDRIQRQSSRAEARGDTGFAINPERRDEARYGGLAQSFMIGKENSRQEARNALLNAARGITGAAAAAPVAAGAARQDANFDRRLSAVSGIPYGIWQLGQLFNQPQSGQDIVWNTERQEPTIDYD